jgi:hypothetical protein
MSSPTETVNQLFRWIGQTLGLKLPSLPFSGVYARLTALFNMLIKGPVPQPTDPLPWNIAVEDDWLGPIPGTKVAINNISIQVEERPQPSPPD